MAVCGVPKAVRGHPEKTIDCGLAFVAKLAEINAQPTPRGTPQALRLRVGISTGPLVAGVIGEIRKTFDVWGDAVNTASRMESNGQPGRVQISQATYAEVTRKGNYIFSANEVQAKGKGLLQTYFVAHKIKQVEQWKF